MPTTIRALLDHADFGLEAVVGGESALERMVLWVHSSDLIDPTPWLEPDQLLLTDGFQFDAHAPLDAVAYCERLVLAGVVALGFATAVIHPRIPEDVVEACRRTGLPLLHVPRSTPFIGVIRHVADINAGERTARQAWSLDAQRAVARAAVRRDGMREILRTLSQRLDTWVALYDSTGTRTRIPGLATIPLDWSAVIDRSARLLLERGMPAAVRTEAPHPATLQTVGSAGRLKGVLAVGAGAAFDGAESDLVESVIALASVALEQQRGVDDARGRVRAAILELLEAGAVRAADRTARAIWGPLPHTPLRVVALRGPIPGPGVRDELEIVATGRSGDLFFAERDEDIIVVTGAEAVDDLVNLVARHSLRAGVSSAVPWTDLARAISEALDAAPDAGGGGLARFEDRAVGGMLTALRRGGGDLVASRLLDPLDRLPDDEARRLLDAARAWLAANTAWDPAARTLGIHRHTLRSRIERLGQVVGLDLDHFGDRAELWAALHFRVEEVSVAPRDADPSDRRDILDKLADPRSAD